MWICRTVGTLIATIKEPSLRSNKLLLVQRTGADGVGAGEIFVALDAVGAGEDELVVVAHGSAARETDKTRDAPVDAAIVGIVDSIAARGKRLFSKDGEI